MLKRWIGLRAAVVRRFACAARCARAIGSDARARMRGYALHALPRARAALRALLTRRERACHSPSCAYRSPGVTTTRTPRCVYCQPAIMLFRLRRAPQLFCIMP